MIFSLRGVAAALCIALVAAVVPGRASALTFDDVVFFGDSLSDSGNMFFLSGGLLPPSPPYAGRASNGPVWSEYFAASYGLAADPVYPTVLPFPSPPIGNNYAVVGALTTQQNEFDGIAPGADFPGLADQVGLYSALVGGGLVTVDPNDLYVVWAGANDLLPPPLTPPGPGITPSIADTVNNLVAAIIALESMGAQKFLIPNMPDLGLTPRALLTDLFNPGDIAQELTDLAADFNAALDVALSNLSLSLGISIKTADVFGFLNDVVANPAAFGLTNVTDSCLDLITFIPCINPDEYLFWDDVHPQTAIHERLAAFMVQSVPEPGSLALLLAGLVSLTVFERRRRAQGVALLGVVPARSLSD